MSSLVCLHCNTRVPLPDRCQSCRSVRFKFIALGTEKIAELMKRQFPDSRVIEITQKHALHEPPKDMYRTVIVGTSFLPYAFPETFCDIGLIGILSADPIISPNDFRAEERHWQTLFHLRMLAKSNDAQFILQTFNPDNIGIQSLAIGNYLSYAHNALLERKVHGWPPETRLIRIRLSVSSRLRSRRIGAETDGAEKFRNKVAHTIIQHCASLGLSVRSKTANEILLSYNQQYLTRNELPESLWNFLMSIPSDWLIDIDPVVL